MIQTFAFKKIPRQSRRGIVKLERRPTNAFCSRLFRAYRIKPSMAAAAYAQSTASARIVSAIDRVRLVASVSGRRNECISNMGGSGRNDRFRRWLRGQSISRTIPLIAATNIITARTNASMVSAMSGPLRIRC